MRNLFFPRFCYYGCFYIPLQNLTVIVIWKFLNKEFLNDPVNFIKGVMPSIFEFFGKVPSRQSSVIRIHRWGIRLPLLAEICERVMNGLQFYAFLTLTRIVWQQLFFVINIILLNKFILWYVKKVQKFQKVLKHLKLDFKILQ